MMLTTEWIDLLYASDGGTGNGSATDFILTYTPKSAVGIVVSLNGIKKDYGVDYTVNLSTKTVSFITAPATAQKINCTYLRLN